MKTPARVQHRVLIRIEESARAHEFTRESSLSAKAAAGNDDGLAFPSDRARVYEDAPLRSFSHVQLQVRFERVHHLLFIKRAYQPLQISVQKIVATHMRARRVPANEDGIESFDHVRARRLPGGRQS